MTGRLPPLDGVELKPADRFEWERVVRYTVMPELLKGFAILLATYANRDGSRVRPGEPELSRITGRDGRTVRRRIGLLRDQYGLIRRTSRGGGRGGAGRATTYQLTIPVDLLDRCEVLTPDGRSIGLTGHPAEPETDEPAQSPDTQVPAQRDHTTVDDRESPDTTPDSPDINLAAQCATSPVDKPDHDGFHRTPDDGSQRLTGHLASIDRTPSCPTTNHRPTTTEDQQPPGPLTQPPDAHGPGLTGHPELSAKARKCPHGLPGHQQTDGTPRCPLCRRNAAHLAEPPALAAIA